MKRLRELRAQRHLTQAEVAEQLHISKQSYGFYENGTRNPDPEMLSKLADFYNVTTDYLLERSDMPIDMNRLSSLSKNLLLELKDADSQTLTELQQYLNFLKYKNSDELTAEEKK